MPQKREGENSGSRIKTGKLKAFYREHFPGLRTHHLVPRSRGGPTSCFNLFPWAEKSHDAWHQLFFNMTIQEVGERLDEIHAAIYSDAERVIPFWVGTCTLFKAGSRRMKVFEEQKASKLSSPVSTAKLQGLWWDCFKSEKLADARTLMLHMVMFMVFGPQMADPDLVSQTDVQAILSKISEMKNYRRWAVGVCLGYGISTIISRVNQLNSSSP